MSDISSGLKSRYGPWAVITGASEGIGREFARKVAQSGLDLVLVARRKPELDALAAELGQAHNVNCRVLACDLGTPDTGARIAEATRDIEVGLLVACAGFGTSGSFLEVDVAQELNMIDVNCRALTELTHVFGRRMAERRRGGIVLMSSLVAFQGVPRASTYAATKAFVQVLAEGIRRELKPYQVDVIASAPGPVESGFGRRAEMTMGMSQGPEIVAEQTLAAIGRKGTVRPGWLSKLLESSLAPLPRRARTSIMQKVMAGMAKPPPAPASGKHQ